MPKFGREIVQASRIWYCWLGDGNHIDSVKKTFALTILKDSLLGDLGRPSLIYSMLRKMGIISKTALVLLLLLSVVIVVVMLRFFCHRSAAGKWDRRWRRSSVERGEKGRCFELCREDQSGIQCRGDVTFRWLMNRRAQPPYVQLLMRNFNKYCRVLNMCQPVTRNLQRRRLRSAVRGDLIVLLRGQSVTVHAALQSLGHQRGTRYQHHSATANSLPCHFIASWRLNYTWEHVFRVSMPVTVFSVRVGKHNSYVIIIIIIITYCKNNFGVIFYVSRCSSCTAVIRAVLMATSSGQKDTSACVPTSCQSPPDSARCRTQ